MSRVPSTIVAVLLVLCCSLLQAGVPSEAMLPLTTKGWFSSSDYSVLSEKFTAAQWGKMVNDPLMKPFVDDARRQIRERMEKNGSRLGITLDDLGQIAGGETCFFLVQPGGDITRAVDGWVIDVTGKSGQANAVLTREANRMVRDGAKKSAKQVAGVAVTVFEFPLKQGEKIKATVLHCLHAKSSTLIVVDDEKTGTDIVSRLAAFPQAAAGVSEATLKSVVAFQNSLARCDKEAATIPEQNRTPHLRWFIEPFGFAEAIRAARGGRKRKGADPLKVFKKEAWTAVQGAGGHMYFDAIEYDVFHREFVYAPADPKAKSPDKYRLSARMMDFPNGGDLTVPGWVAEDVANSLSFNWKLKPAFEYSKTLINEWMDDEQFFEDLMESLATDPKGPKISVRKDIVAHLGERALFSTDFIEPVGPKSQRKIMAFQIVGNVKAVDDAVRKAQENDKDSVKHVVGPYTVWETVETPKSAKPATTKPKPGSKPKKTQPVQEEKPLFNAVTVAHNWLIFSSHASFLIDTLKKAEVGKTLVKAKDYQQVMVEVRDLGGRVTAKVANGAHSFEYFTRMDRNWRVDYQMLKEGKMPESDTILARMLNQFGPPPEVKDGKEIPRKQEFDGSKMPNYSVAAKYLQPGGMWVQSENDGWYVVGFVWPKLAPGR